LHDLERDSEMMAAAVCTSFLIGLPRRIAIRCKALLLLYLLMVFIHKLGSVVLLIIASTLTEDKIFDGRHITSPKLQLPSHLLVF